MSIWEFALMVPLMTAGAPFNSLEFGLSRTRQVLYGLALAPATLVALAMALLQLPRYAAKRRQGRERARRRHTMSDWSFLVPPGISVTLRARSRPALLARCLDDETAPAANPTLLL